MSKPMLILAGTYQEAKEAGIRAGCAPGDIRYVNRIDKIFGLRGEQMLVAGTATLRDDYDEIITRARLQELVLCDE
jgi:hypothetical protein